MALVPPSSPPVAYQRPSFHGWNCSLVRWLFDWGVITHCIGKSSYLSFPPIFRFRSFAFHLQCHSRYRLAWWTAAHRRKWHVHLFIWCVHNPMGDVPNECATSFGTSPGNVSTSLGIVITDSILQSDSVVEWCTIRGNTDPLKLEAVYQLTDWLTGWLAGCLFGWFTCWFTGWLVRSFICLTLLTRIGSHFIIKWRLIMASNATYCGTTIVNFAIVVQCSTSIVPLPGFAWPHSSH